MINLADPRIGTKIIFKTDDFFDQVTACNNHVKPGHHQKYDDPVIVERKQIHAQSLRPAKARKTVIMTAATVIPTPSSTRNIPRCWPSKGFWASVS